MLLSCDQHCLINILTKVPQGVSACVSAMCSLIHETLVKCKSDMPGNTSDTSNSHKLVKIYDRHMTKNNAFARSVAQWCHSTPPGSLIMIFFTVMPSWTLPSVYKHARQMHKHTTMLQIAHTRRLLWTEFSLNSRQPVSSTSISLLSLIILWMKYRWAV